MENNNVQVLCCSGALWSNLMRLVRSRSAVRLCRANYDSPRAYRAERREIESQTRRLDMACRASAFRRDIFPLEFASCLISATHGTRFHVDELGKWSYTVGQHQPTEIRAAAAALIEKAEGMCFRVVTGG